MTSTATHFTIPEDLINVVPCQTKAALFSDPALDIDMDDDDWVLLTRDEQFARLAAKQVAEARALAACAACPALERCREWALAAGQDVFGVVGGLTQAERPNAQPAPAVTDYTERGPLGQVRDDLIERWAAIGISNKQIAERLSCNVRTVERRRAGITSGAIIIYNPEDPTRTPYRAPAVSTATATLAAVPATAAKIPLLAQRVTAETAAMYDALADGAFHDRQTVIAAAINAVDRTQALNTAPKNRRYASDDVQAAVGARKFLMNRLDIAVRRGRIQTITSDGGKTLLCLEAETVETWAAWTAKNATRAAA